MMSTRSKKLNPSSPKSANEASAGALVPLSAMRPASPGLAGLTLGVRLATSRQAIGSGALIVVSLPVSVSV
jgi:hypothetical protein